MGSRSLPTRVTLPKTVNSKQVKTTIRKRGLTTKFKLNVNFYKPALLGIVLSGK